ncbi:MAG TPA: Holliday junction branch migration protein RuvA [Sedimentisphaerales bacterium]|nr:Holliday junction branch migration protein RuvA [Sedimentisphaerales bacterium]
MIARVEGKLVKLDSESALVQVGAVGYEVMLPSYCVSALSDKIGADITLCTMEYYEGTPGGGNLIPRMVGFLNAGERDFFTKFISVKGMGIKKGLRSLSIPIATIAAVIENGDDETLLSLPGVGKRMAQQIIAELRGKLQTFAVGADAVSSAEVRLKPFQAEALEILIVWGEKRSDAMELIELACKKHPDINSAEELVPLVYRLKQGVEV